MGMTLSIDAPTLDNEDLQILTRDLCATLQRETDLIAELPEGEAASGTKGDPITIGTIILAVVTSGVAAKLVDVLRAYFERHSKLEIKFERADGKNFSIKADNLAQANLQQTMTLARDFLGEQK